MVQNLEQILRNLHSNKNRLAFLEMIYTQGNFEVADEIINLKPNSSIVLEKEIEYARANNLSDRFHSYAKKLIDYYLLNGFDILARDEVKKWNDKELSDYAVKKLVANGEDSSLEYASELLTRFGNEEEAKNVLSRLFSLRMIKYDIDRKYPYSPAEIAEKIGMFKEALDLFIRADYLEHSLKIAEENVPERIAEVAKLGYHSYSLKTGSSVFFLRCARILGKESSARNTLLAEAENVNSETASGFHQVGLVKALVSLDFKIEARKLAEKLEKYVVETYTTRNFDLGNNNLAEMFLAIGDKEKAAQAYMRNVEMQLDQHPNNFMPELEKAFELTGDKAILEKKLLVLERIGEYNAAAVLARELENDKLADVYETMQQMIDKVNK